MNFAAIFKVNFEAPDEESAKDAIDQARLDFWELMPELPEPKVSVQPVTQRVIPMEHQITAFFHCAACYPPPPGVAPADHSQIECGWTPIGFQVWCRRCKHNVMHIDFEGMKHPANTRTPKKEGE